MSEATWTPHLADRMVRLEERLLADPANVAVITTGVEIDGEPVALTLDPDRRMGIRLPGVEGNEDRHSPTLQAVVTPAGLTLTCRDWNRRALFLRVGEDLLERLADGEPPSTTPARVIADWRGLFAGAPGQRLTPQALAGLFGELIVLRQMLDAGGTVEWWSGWDKDHVDFRLPGVAVEVKSTLDADHKRIEVHGLAQLDDPPDGSRLLLCLKRLTHSPNGMSVPDLVDDLTLHVPEVELRNRLVEAGYQAEHEQDYRLHRFVVEEVALYEVDGAFPRLTEAMLTAVAAPAVESVDYRLNLGTLELAEHPVALADELTEAASGGAA